MERLYQTYKSDAEFLLVYIREAHPDSVLFVENDGKEELLAVTQTDTLLERIATAQTCSASLHLSIPTLIDKEDNAVNAAYAGWPDRLVVVGVDGNVAYYGGKGPGGFKPQEVEKWLEELRAHREGAADTKGGSSDEPKGTNATENRRSDS